MTNVVDDDLELIRGSGNLYRDLGYPDAEVRQLKAMLAAEIIGVLDDKGLTVRKAEEMSGVPASDFSRIRNARLQRFTIDRLMAILAKMDREIEVSIKTRVVTSKTSGITAVQS